MRSPVTGTVLQEQGDHAYTTKSTFEMSKTGTWRQESPRGFVRELSPNAGGATGQARSAAVLSATVETASSTSSGIGGTPFIDRELSTDRLTTQFATPETPFSRTGRLMNATESTPVGRVLSRISQSRRDSYFDQTSNAGSTGLPVPWNADLGPETDAVFARWPEFADSLP